MELQDLHERISALEKENEDLKTRLRYLDDCSGAENTSNLSLLDKASLRGSSATSQDTLLEEDPKKMLHYLKSILGFSIYVSGSTFILRSVYSFSEEDFFEIEIQQNKLVLKNTPYLSEWKEQFNNYVVTGRSYAAFFAAVTLELFNRRTFG